MLPFSWDVLRSHFEQVNAVLWPVGIVAVALALIVVWWIAKPKLWSGRLIALILTIFWAWNGAVYHGLQFAGLNFWAPVSAIVFLIQALLFFWTGVVRGRLAFRFQGDAASRAGLALMIFALVLYPLLWWLGGSGLRSIPEFGITPGPTNVFTLGVLLLAAPRVPIGLSIIPLLWCVVWGLVAWFLPVPVDLSLVAAGLVFAGFAMRRSAEP